MSQMSARVVGQRYMSEREPELGLGVVVSVEGARTIGIEFPATGEKRLYAANTPVLKRVQFREGDTVTMRDGTALEVEAVEERDGLLTYLGGGHRVSEDEISDVTNVSLPQERLAAGHVDEGEVFDLRFRTLLMQWRLRQSPVRGFLGGRLELIPHQIYILQEVSSRQIPRVLLADEVGLGKTIEACLILQRLLAVGKASRVLILVPESLTHQWFVELLRRFNLWFSIYDEERCAAAEQGEAAANPFLDQQLALCSVSFLVGSEVRRAQAVAAGWDMIVVDEAHHLEWAPDEASPEYLTVEQLAYRTPGLLLLTATPTQLGLEGHFARLRLLDPDRYSNYEDFLREADDFGAVAAIAGRVIDGHPLAEEDQAALKRIFDRDPAGLEAHLAAVAGNKPGARDKLLRALLDEHGTGRVVLRNTRANMTNFPSRQFCPVPLSGGAKTLHARLAREIEAEETGNEAAIRYSFKDDRRIDWLVAFLQEHRPAKVLLISKSQRKVEAIKAAMQERTNIKIGIFHEGLELVQRDRNAAWFAEAEGAQLLVCSEIGSEGRNFQFAHHLVLFDLPLNPGLLEQRIGRLDRIGQTETIRIHVPFIQGGAEERLVEWYHRGLDAFEKSLHGGEEYVRKFRTRVLSTALHGDNASFAQLVDETAEFHRDLSRRMAEGRDRLLELNSFDREVADRVIAQIRAEDGDPSLRAFLFDLLDHFGVRLNEHEEGDVFLDPSHAYVEGFPSIPHEGMLATFDRRRAIAREDIRFVSADHSLVRDAIDLLINAQKGSTAFGFLAADTPNLMLEAVFVLEAVADPHWHVEQFLAPTPVHVVVDIRGHDLTSDYPVKTLAAEVEDANIHRFLERPGFSAAVLKAMVDGASGLAEARSLRVKDDARAAAEKALGAELQRLVDLKKINDLVRDDEVVLAREQLKRTDEAIDHARLRLDAIRLVVAGPESLRP